ncbi:hypothetical protein V2J09_010261 [Rumex salicifolius]
MFFSGFLSTIYFLIFFSGVQNRVFFWLQIKARDFLEAAFNCLQIGPVIELRCGILTFRAVHKENACTGTMLDQANCSKMSMEERRKLVYELAEQDGDPEALLSWSRHDILQLLCAEMGKERKYTGLTKLKIIENLLKIVSEKSSNESEARVTQQPILDSSFPTPTDSMHSVIQCKNSACKASLSPGDLFCKRCSCCICLKFDDNKDPSLWLTCASEPPFEGESCNMSCHLDCALKHERSGLSEKGQVAQLDGSFYCVSCGKMNDLLKCWRKQLIIARDTRRADILCYRVSLTQKLLNGTNKYQNLSEIIDEAVNKLQAEVGPLTDITVKMGRGIVNRMSSGHQVQRLCTSAVKLIDAILSVTTAHSLTNPADQDSRNIRFEDIGDTSVAVILGPANQAAEPNMRYTMWHRKAVDDEKEPPEPTCTLSLAGTRIVIHGLIPSTEYVFKVVSFDSFNESASYETRLSTAQEKVNPRAAASSERSQSPITNSTLSNPSSVEDETNNITSDLNEKNSTKNAPNNAPSLDQSRSVLKPQNGLNKPPTTGLEIVPCPLPEKDEGKNGEQRRSSKKRKREKEEEDMEFYVKVIRRLECEGHIDKSFRKKLLTWYVLKATPQEMQVVQVFVNAFRDDLASLAEQIIDAFGDVVLCKRSEAMNPPGFCMKLWH